VKKFRTSALNVCTREDSVAEFEFAHRCPAHPNVVRVLEVDMVIGSLIMEYVDGCSLDIVLQEQGALEETSISLSIH
jgi:hypothetical protein